MKRAQIPAFGYWDYCDEMPITQYFDNAIEAGLIKGHFFVDQNDDVDDDLFKVPVAPVFHYHGHRKILYLRVLQNVKVKKGGGEKHRQQVKEQLKKHGKVPELTTQSPRKAKRAPKAVDEDLYKIPPELLCPKPKRKRLLRSLWTGCLGLDCIA